MKTIRLKSVMAILLAFSMLCCLMPIGAMAASADEAQLKEELLDTLDIKSEIEIAALDGGKYFAVFLADDSSKSAENNPTAYYAIYDGSDWSQPEMLDDDGTKDYMPAINDLGNGQLFITWSTASRTFDSTTDEKTILLASDIKGVFVEKSSGDISAVLQVTKETEDDVYGDKDALAVYSEDTHLMLIFYIKYDVFDDGGVYNTLTTRVYDTLCKEFVYAPDAPDGDWYDQVLNNTCPSVIVEETLDASGYWTEYATIIEAFERNGFLTEFDVTYFDGQALISYVYDYDGDLSTENDRDVFVGFFELTWDTVLRHPTMIANTDKTESDVEFIEVNGTKYLSYLSDGRKVKFNISNNLTYGDALQEWVTDDGVWYYYIDKSVDSGYIPPISPVQYIDEDGNTQECGEYTAVDNSTTWTEGWYYLKEDITIDDRITVSGDVHLILGDGCTLTANKGIEANEDNKLTIYAQSTGDDMGAIVATGVIYCAGIGGGGDGDGNVTINGGDITATGGYYAAGIGGGDNGGTGNVTINGGTINATGGYNGPGIGGGKSGDANITITNGTITAIGGNYGAGIGSGKFGATCTIIIDGGTINATGGNYGAGIGSSFDGDASVTITNGTITATGGEKGAGIGGGYLGNGEVNITGGEITSTAGDYAAGIGGGYDGNGEVNITGGEITSTGGEFGAGIGGGISGNGNISISGGEITATGGLYGAGIGGGDDGDGNVTITGGEITATGGGSGADHIGGGSGGSSVVVTPTPTPTATPAVTPTVTPTATPAVTPTATPTATATATPAVTPTVTPTATPAVTPTATPTATPAVTPTVAPSATATATPTATPTAAPTATPTATAAPTATPAGDADVPATGDSGTTALWIAIIVVASALVTFVIVERPKKSRR